MNALFRWLALPWCAAPRSLRVNVLLLTSLFGAGMATTVLFIHGTPAHPNVAPSLMGLAAAYFWWLSIGSRSLLVLQDAWNLRLPRTLARGLALVSSALTQAVLLPALLMALTGVPPLTALSLLLALACVLMAHSVLPKALAIPALLLVLAPLWSPPPSQWLFHASTLFTGGILAVAACSLLVFVYGARRLLLQPSLHRGYWRTPQIIVSRPWLDPTSTWQGVRYDGTANGTGTSAQKGTTRHASVQSAQATATRAIRIMLGPPYAPQRLSHAARPWLLALLVGALIELLAAHFLPATLVLTDNVIAMPVLVLAGSVLVPVLASARLWRMFAHTTAPEVALLALLPGLGSARMRRRALLRATLVPAVCLWGGVTAILAFVWLALLGESVVVPGILLQAVLGAVLTSGAVLAALNGRDLRITGVALAAIMFVYWQMTLVLLATVLPRLLGQATPQPLPDGRQALQLWLTLAVAVFWLAMLIFSAAVMWRQWRVFMRRPHPFMQR